MAGAFQSPITLSGSIRQTGRFIGFPAAEFATVDSRPAAICKHLLPACTQPSANKLICTQLKVKRFFSQLKYQSGRNGGSTKKKGHYHSCRMLQK